MPRPRLRSSPSRRGERTKLSNNRRLQSEGRFVEAGRELERLREALRIWRATIHDGISLMARPDRRPYGTDDASCLLCRRRR
jgi:hypothetical protein